MEKNYNTGNIYGSFVSRSGKWLNLMVATAINGVKYFVCVPVKLGDLGEGRKPCATLCGDMLAKITNLPVYEMNAPKQEETAEDDIPF